MIAGLAAIALACAAPADAQPADRPASQPEPTLDELLGTQGATPRRETDATVMPRDLLEPSRADLDRRLGDTPPSQLFEEAIALMGDASTRLSAARDTGLTTQRLQQDVLNKLDQAIAAAREQQGQSSSSSSSSSEQQQQQQQQQQRQQQADSSADGTRTDLPPGGGRGELGLTGVIDEAGWGALPPRVRDALRQGSGDTFSSLYRAMTEAYYRRLAEQEGSQR